MSMKWSTFKYKNTDQYTEKVLSVYNIMCIGKEFHQISLLSQYNLWKLLQQESQILTDNPGNIKLLLLTHCRLNELPPPPHTIYWEILILTLGISGYVI